MTLLIALLAAPASAAEDSRFGFNHIWLDPKHAGTTCSLDSYPILSATGAGWVRPHPGPMVWQSIETSSGYTWLEADKVVGAAHGAGFSILMTIFPYQDANQSGCNADLPTKGVPFDAAFMPELFNYRQAPCGAFAYPNFLGVALDRYDRDGANDMPNLSEAISYWEVANEPSLHLLGDEVFFYGDPVSYAPVIQDTWAEVSALGMSTLNGGMYALEFQAKTYWTHVLADAENEIDIFSYHMIGGTSADPDSRVGELIGFLNATLSSGSAYPIWVTELEFDASEFSPTVTDEEVIDHVIETYVRTFAAGAEKIFMAGADYDQSYATCPGAPSVSANPFALVDTSGVKTDLYDAFTTMVEAFGAFDTVTEPHPHVFQFDTGSDTVYVAMPAANATDYFENHLGYAPTDTVDVTIPATAVTNSGVAVGGLGSHAHIRFIE